MALGAVLPYRKSDPSTTPVGGGGQGCGRRGMALPEAVVHSLASSFDQDCYFRR